MNKNFYDVQVLSTVEEIIQASKEWGEFLERYAYGHNFWQDPQIISLNLKYVDQGEPRIILLRKNGKIECVAPCVINKTRFNLNLSVFRFRGPLIRVLKIVDSNFIFSRDADLNSCVKKILEVLKSIGSHFDVIKADSLEDSSPLGEFFKRTEDHSHKPFQLKTISPKKEQVWRHVFANSYEEWLATLGNSTRRLIKRRVQNLYKQYPEKVELMRVTSNEDVPKFFDLLDELYPKTWQSKTFGLRKRNNERDVLFYKSIADQGLMRSYMLMINSLPVAFLIGTQYADIFEAQEIGYDNEFSSIGVGSTLNYMIINDLYCYDKPSVLNFGFGENIYKQLLCNTNSDAAESYIIGTNIWGILVKLQILLSSIENKIRIVLIKYRLDSALRKILKRK